MRLRSISVVIVVVCVITVGSAQYRNTSPSGDTREYLQGRSSLGVRGIRGLLDPSRMHMSHSVSFGYVSMGGQSATQGLYMNRLDYRISQPLSLTTHLGYAFQPSGPAEWNPAARGGEFVGGADLNWRPTSNAHFRLSAYRGIFPMRSYSGYYGWPDDYGPYPERP